MLSTHRPITIIAESTYLSSNQDPFGNFYCHMGMSLPFIHSFFLSFHFE